MMECASCSCVVEERRVHSHPHFLLHALNTPHPPSTPDLLPPPHNKPQPLPPPPPPQTHGDHSHHGGSGDDDDDDDDDDYDDPFLPTGFLTAFSAWSLEPTPVFARFALSFSGHLAEIERALLVGVGAGRGGEGGGGGGGADPLGPLVSVDNLGAYLQIIDVTSILGLDHDIADHASELFRDYSFAICLKNRSVESLATAVLMQAIQET